MYRPCIPMNGKWALAQAAGGVYAAGAEGRRTYACLRVRHAATTPATANSNRCSFQTNSNVNIDTSRMHLECHSTLSILLNTNNQSMFNVEVSISIKPLLNS